MPLIKYIGKKPQKIDTPAIAGTGTVWNGTGDVQEVRDQKAVAKLLAHTDSFALVEGEETGTKFEQEEETDEATDKTGEEVPTTNEMSEADALPPLANLEAMDANALREYAQRHFGHEFHPRTGEPKMRLTIISLMNRG